MVESAGLSARITCASAGTTGYHAGEPPDARVQKAALRRGYDLGRQRARQVAPEDFRQFDLMLAMDAENMQALARLRPRNATVQPTLFLEYAGCRSPRDGFVVDDPYYGSGQGFEVMLDVIEAAATKLLASLAA